MSSTIFWRLAWKEYRQQRDLMLAILIIGVVILAAMLAWSYVEGNALRPALAYSVAMMMPVFYALGCGATLFAGEHEKETFAFLRGLPLRGGDVFWPKIAIATTSCVVLGAILMLLAAILMQARPVEPAEGPVNAAVYLAMTLVLLAWAVFYSLLLRNPLWAVSAAGISFFGSLLIAMSVGSLIRMAVAGGSTEPAWVEIWISLACLILFVVLVVADVRLGRTWLSRESAALLPLTRPALEAAPPYAQQATIAQMLFQLWVQWWREGWLVVGAAYAVLILLGLLLASTSERASFGLALGCLPALLGSLTFFHDQWKQHYRFFGERGVNARTVWWGRILASLTACLPYYLVLIAVVIGSQRQDNGVFVWPQDMLLLSLAMFALGQWCSLLFRAGIVGVFAGTAAGLFIVAMLGILRDLGIPDWLGLIVPTALLLWVSWYRAPDWIDERSSWRHWLRYGGVLALPCVLWVAGLAAHRAYEIPALVDATTTVAGPAGIAIPESIAAQHSRALDELQRPPSAEELETAKLYRELDQEFLSLPSIPGAGIATSPPGAGSAASAPPGAAAAPEIDEQQKELAAKRQAKVGELVGRFVEISRREAAAFTPEPLQFHGLGQPLTSVEHLAQVVLNEAQKLTDAGQPEDALERYLAVLRFARHLQQRGTTERIQQALRVEQLANQGIVSWAAQSEQTVESLDKLRSTLHQPPYNFSPGYDVAWMREYLYGQLAVELSPLVWNSGAPQPSGNPQALMLLRWLPWERQRTRRWFDYVSAGHPTSPHMEPYGLNTLLGDLPVSPHYHLSATLRLTHADDRTARELCLMLLAYRREHGELPDSLGELESMYSGQVPANPSTHRGFTYHPYGEGEERRAFLSVLSQSYQSPRYYLGPAKPGAPPETMGGASAAGMGSAPGAAPTPTPMPVPPSDPRPLPGTC